MKKIFLIRHAKSSWSNAHNIEDIDRPLKTRGIKDSYKMAERLLKKEIKPNILISSDGIRALHTAIIFARVLNTDTLNIKVDDNLYHASEHKITRVIQSLDNRLESVFIFCHNPGINNFASKYISNFYDNIPTCGILAFELHAENWKAWSKPNVHLDFFDYPKNLE